MATAILIIGQPGRLRNSLIVILKSKPSLKPIYVADNFQDGITIIQENQPKLIIIDGFFSDEADCVRLKAYKSRNLGQKCLFIADTQDQAMQARNMGMDDAIIRGFSTKTLFTTISTLLRKNDEFLVNNPRGQDPAVIKPYQPTQTPGLT